jgi:hypothetical protein
VQDIKSPVFLTLRWRGVRLCDVGCALTGQADKAKEVIDLALKHCSQDLTGAFVCSAS